MRGLRAREKRIFQWAACLCCVAVECFGVGREEGLRYVVNRLYENSCCLQIVVKNNTASSKLMLSR